MPWRFLKQPSARLLRAVAALLMPALATAEGSADRTETVYYDFVDESGKLSGGRLEIPYVAPEGQARVTIPAPFVTLISNGPPGNRIDLVAVGDGYLATELGTYATHAINGINRLFLQRPFSDYATFFNVHRVDVVSPDSGVDHDPTYPTWRNTALHMGFFCSNIERLLCVNVGVAYNYALNAPDVNQVLAIANSGKYGGAGYTSSELATFAGGNSSAPEIAIHELGHSLGNLADEYDYGDGATYTGGEPSSGNLSTLTSSQMAAAGSKWAAWLGTSDPLYDGLQSTFQGGGYYQFGMYRPSSNSKMRSLGRPFNLPSTEALIIEFYHSVRPIDDSTPAGVPLNPDAVIEAQLVQPVSHMLTVRWILDGATIIGATESQLDLATLSFSPGTHAVTLVVSDDTPLVRNETARATWMTQSRTWTVLVPDPQPGDMNCDGAITVSDITGFVLAVADRVGYADAFPDCDPDLADLNQDGAVTVSDIGPFVALVAGR